MRHTASVWRAPLVNGSAQTIGTYTEIYPSVRCFIQPATSSLQYYYGQRGTVVTHTIYVSGNSYTFQREDIFVDAVGNQYHLTADPINALVSNLYLSLVCEQYPEGAKKRLDT
jgi:hypothetical protein